MSQTPFQGNRVLFLRNYRAQPHQCGMQCSEADQQTPAQLIPNSDTPCTCTASSRVFDSAFQFRHGTLFQFFKTPLCRQACFHCSTRLARRDMDHELKNDHSDAKCETSSLNGESPESQEGSEADVESLASLRKQKDTATEFKGRHIQMMALGTSPFACRVDVRGEYREWIIVSKWTIFREWRTCVVITCFHRNGQCSLFRRGMNPYILM